MTSIDDEVERISLAGTPTNDSVAYTRRSFLKMVATVCAATVGLGSHVYAEMRTVKSFTFDHNENGWEVPRIFKDDKATLEDGVTKIGEKREDLTPDIPGSETLKKGYRLPDGRIVTTFEYDGKIFVYKFNSHGRIPAYGISNVDPKNGSLEPSFKYRYEFNTMIPMPVLGR